MFRFQKKLTRRILVQSGAIERAAATSTTVDLNEIRPLELAIELSEDHFVVYNNLEKSIPYPDLPDGETNWVAYGKAKALRAQMEAIVEPLSIYGEVRNAGSYEYTMICVRLPSVRVVVKDMKDTVISKETFAKYTDKVLKNLLSAKFISNEAYLTVRTLGVLKNPAVPHQEDYRNHGFFRKYVLANDEKAEQLEKTKQSALKK
jgi:hypothetical protein